MSYFILLCLILFVIYYSIPAKSKNEKKNDYSWYLNKQKKNVPEIKPEIGSKFYKPDDKPV